MPTITASGWFLLAIASVIIGISKTGFTGAGILAIPLAAMAFPDDKTKASVGLLLPILLVGDILAVAFYRRHAVWKYLVKILPCAMAGILIGYELMDKISDRQLRPFIGAVILVLLILNYCDWRLAKSDEIHVPEGWWFALIMGLTGGILTMMANAAGPIVVIYLLAMRLPKTAFIGTGAWYFLLLNSFKIPLFWHIGLITPGSLWLNLELAPFIILGGLAGYWFIKFVPEKPFTRIVQVLAAAAALQLLVTGLWTAQAPSPAKAPAPRPAALFLLPP